VEALMKDPTWMKVQLVTAITATIVMVGLFLYWTTVFLRPFYPDAGPILRDHLAAIIGLPIAAIVSFVIVVVLRQIEGPFEISGPSFTIKGATGPIIFWALCFFVIAWAIKDLWILK
jgi:hypothetical protein